MDKLIQGLVVVVLLSFIIERALAVFFDMEKLRDRLSKYDLKPWISIVVSIAVCGFLQFDILRVLTEADVMGVKLGTVPPWLGIGLTGLTVAGGSAGAVKLFQDVLGLRRTTRDEQRKVAMEEQAAALEEAKARQVVAEATKQAAILQIASPAMGASSAETLRERDFAKRLFEIAAGKHD